MSADSSTNPAGPQLPAVPATPAAPASPAYLANLVGRAASMLKARGVGQCVEFSWFAAGVSTPYFARMEWAGEMTAPRVNVYRAASGDCVCRSLIGQPYEIDSSNWGNDVAEDEIDLSIWLAARHPTKT